eukprot:9439161-Pyramimonas_sp.AAC.1
MPTQRSIPKRIAQNVRAMTNVARVSRVAQSPGVHQRIPIIVRHVLICSNERIYDGIAVASPGGHLMTEAAMTAD